MELVTPEIQLICHYFYFFQFFFARTLPLPPFSLEPPPTMAVGGGSFLFLPISWLAPILTWNCCLPTLEEGLWTRDLQSYTSKMYSLLQCLEWFFVGGGFFLFPSLNTCFSNSVSWRRKSCECDLGRFTSKMFSKLRFLEWCFHTLEKYCWCSFS